MIIKLIVFKVLFAILSFFNLDISNQINIKTVFLYDFIDQLIYIKISRKFEIKENCNIVCKVLKVLYKLK